MNNVEIERKFLLKALPENLDSYPHHELEQGYLCQSPVVRIRRSDDEYYLTYKGKGLMERSEYNLPLTREGYEHLLPKADGHLITKTRYVIPLTATQELFPSLSAEKLNLLSLCIELDIFKFPKDLIMAEIEFPDTESANAFCMPDYFLSEVTNDPRYHNVNMIYSLQ